MTEEKISEIANNKIIEYAQNMNSEEWHKMAMDWNYDNSKTFLKWLINNSNTDKATILMIYWMSSPKHGFEFQEDIEKNYSSGFYKNQNFEFDPKDDNGLDWTNEYPELKSDRIPLIMFDKLKGKVIQSSDNYIEGLPEDLFNEIEELYE